MKLLAGFLNTEKTCGCNKNYYVLPVKEGDCFYLVVEDEIGALASSFAFMLLAVYGNKKIYQFCVNSVSVATNPNNFLTWQKNISFYCSGGSPVDDYCQDSIEALCESFDPTCFQYADRYDSLLEWEQKFAWYPLNNGWFYFAQRLRIRLTKPQPKIEGLKTYQKSSGVVLRTGRLKRYVEYTLETDFLPELFHRQLLEVLSNGRNLKINGKEVEFAGDYQIDWQSKQDCFAKATCKIIEKEGSPVRC